VVSYSFLLMTYFLVGVTESSALVMEVEASRYDHRRANNPEAPLPNTSTISAFVGFDTVPENIRSIFPEDSHVDRQVLSSDRFIDIGNDDDDLILFFPYQLSDGQTLYLVEQIPSAALDVRDDTFQINNLLLLVWLVGLGFVLVWVVGTAWVTRRINRRAQRLAQWARALRPGSLSSEPPDFGYREYNEIAAQLAMAFRRVAEAAEREHSFLRNASHELRTPIAVVQSNVELIERQKDKSNPVAISRIKRATGNMRQLTETLLWLTRENENALQPTKVSLDRLVRDVIDDNSYLLQGKDVATKVDGSNIFLQAPETPCRIVVSNLIRNAFQYTQTGTVSVQLSSRFFRIRNWDTDGGEDASGSGVMIEESYGLGLLLVQKIADRMGWGMDYQQISGGRETTIFFADTV